MSIKKVFSFLRQNKLFTLILFIGLFFRIYRLADYFDYSHEQDLQAWIVKDILINHHPRLIGQETSITGLFIGPLYYYTLAIFFALFNFNPLASYIPITFVSTSTLISLYFVAKKLYNQNTAIIASLIYAISPAIVFLDRWVVPTQPTLLWTVWFYFVVINFLKGNIKPLPVLIILTGFIWHIHIAFVPLFGLIPIALVLGRVNLKQQFKNINQKSMLLSFFIACFLMTPFFIFEIKHGFQQIKGVFGINNFLPGQAYETRQGMDKFTAIATYINNVIWSPLTGGFKSFLFFIAFLFLPIVLFLKKILSKNELVIIYFWLLITFIFQLISKRIISQYYFNNLIIISLLLFARFINAFFNKKLIYLATALFFLVNLKTFFSTPIPVGQYRDKTKITQYIGQAIKTAGYQCVGINYIGDIPVRYGYRFLLFKNGVKQISPTNDIPIFSIVQPESLSASEVVFTSGDIGVIPPQKTNEIDYTVCDDPSRQLLPLNGFVN